MSPLQSLENCVHCYNFTNRVTCTHENFCTLLIPLSKDNLNLPMSFFLPFTWLPPALICHVVIPAPLLCCTNFFFLLLFAEVEFVA